MLLLLLGACEKEILQPQDVMDRIEKSVTLPDGAAPVSAYDRYYAFDKPGEVKAVYLRAPNQSAGKRSWLVDPAKLPIGFDGDCRLVTVLYDVPAKRFISVTCYDEAKDLS
ncbi:MAG: hypothetical protein P0Y56_11610 [Candidatus Andeanibacterium colombiense]|uniref:Uncharacterized protein n=1 Tax=Candidatus Andeanibacterium colombiense TaxID=3121345 RepID=A0AAJ5X485_9SPHN|nr:MAG: hypothetical protein P0Y56_11610 [Sphingomonadaceae bacterium]